MSDFSSPRLRVIVDSATTAQSRVVGDVRGMSSLGLAEIRAQIISGTPVIDVEMFTNEWYDGQAAQILEILGGWEVRGIQFTLVEAPGWPDDAATEAEASSITLDTLRNIISAGEDERARMEELDDLRYRDAE